MALGFHAHIHLILKVLEEPGKVNKARRFCHSGISPVGGVIQQETYRESIAYRTHRCQEGEQSSKEDSAGVCEGKSPLPEGGIRNTRWWKQSVAADTEKKHFPK